MTDRYSLRFESGARKGETIPLAGEALTFGRQPGNSVQISDASVSGKHAELELSARGVVLRDLGSTNGTRVGPAKVTEKVLAHGDQVFLGNVQFSFFDAQIQAVPAVSGDSADDGIDIEGELGKTSVHSISTEKVERSAARSKVPLLVLLLLAVGGGAAGYFAKGEESSGGRKVRPVAAVAGNLLADSYSFELDGKGDDAASWASDPGASAEFLPSTEIASSGVRALQANLIESERALHRSPDLRATPGRSLIATAEMSAGGDVRGRLGIEFHDTQGQASDFAVWGDLLEDTGGFQNIGVRARMPEGYDRCRVLLYAEAFGGEDAVGAVDADDVTLLQEGEGGGGVQESGEYRLASLGAPIQGASLHKIDRVFLSGLQVASVGGAAGQRADLEILPVPEGHEFKTSKSTSSSKLVVRAETEAVERIATLGAGGYQTHTVAFEEDGVTSCVLGRGVDLMRLRFNAPCKALGRPEEGAFRLEFEVGTGSFLLQLSFEDEKREAGDLAHAAREAERTGDLGTCLAKWNALLEGYPFEEDLTGEAESARARLTQAGLLELQTVRDEFERADFFRLVGLFRQCRSRAEDVAERYANSNVETECRELIVNIDATLAELEKDLHVDEAQRLRDIATVLRAGEMDRLAERVDTYLQEEFPGNAQGDGQGDR